MQQGGLATIVLWGLLATLVFLGCIQDGIAASAQAQYNYALKALLFYSTVFFVWAMYNTVSDSSLDLGVISLGSVMLTTLFGLCNAPYGASTEANRPPTDALFIFSSCLLVAANYAYVLILDEVEHTLDLSTMFVIYAWSGVCIWLANGALVLILLQFASTQQSGSGSGSGSGSTSQRPYSKIPQGTEAA